MADGLSHAEVRVRVNGEARQIDCEVRVTLADALRDHLDLTGTHLGCEHGVCGSCTVLLDGEPVRSCLVLAAQCQGHDVRTVEGLASADAPLHPLQEAFAEHGALQCGFCTPGFLMLLVGVLEEDPTIGDAELDEAISSNLCRCTGYDGIVAAARAARAGVATWPIPPALPLPAPAAAPPAPAPDHPTPDRRGAPSRRVLATSAVALAVVAGVAGLARWQHRARRRP